MPAFLLTIGIVSSLAGLFALGFAVPIHEFSLGNTLILAGTLGIVGGLLLIGLGAAVRELRRVTRLLERGARPARPDADAAAASARPSAPGAMPPPPRPAAPPPVPPSGGRERQPVEPRFDAPPVERAPEVDRVRDGARPGPFPMPRTVEPVSGGRAAAAVGTQRGSPTTGLRSKPVPVEKPVEDEEDFKPEFRPTPPPLATAPSSEPEPEPDAEPARSPETAEMEREARNLFESVWPTRGEGEKSGGQRDASADDDSQQKAPTILKSGVIDGMAYTLYTDGSIEAQLARGVVRFASVDELRQHIEKEG